MTPEYIWKEIKVSSLAKQIGISRKSIYAWKERKKIPAERVLEVVKHYPNLKKSDLRPDLWD